MLELEVALATKTAYGQTRAEEYIDWGFRVSRAWP